MVRLGRSEESQSVALDRCQMVELLLDARADVGQRRNDAEVRVDGPLQRIFPRARSNVQAKINKLNIIEHPFILGQPHWPFGHCTSVPKWLDPYGALGSGTTVTGTYRNV